MGCREWWEDLDDHAKLVIMVILFGTSIGSIIPVTALGVTLSGGTDDGDDDDGYAAANATSYYNTTAENTTSTSVEYETGAFGKVLLVRHRTEKKQYAMKVMLKEAVAKANNEEQVTFDSLMHLESFCRRFESF